jgi:hypothetical protein
MANAALREKIGISKNHPKSFLTEWFYACSTRRGPAKQGHKQDMISRDPCHKTSNQNNGRRKSQQDQLQLFFFLPSVTPYTLPVLYRSRPGSSPVLSGAALSRHSSRMGGGFFFLQRMLN